VETGRVKGGGNGKGELEGVKGIRKREGKGRRKGGGWR
jgi:hypothetical protein